MKDLDTEKLRRSQPAKSAELDRRLLERAEKLTEGRKTIGESRDPVFSVLNAKEDNTMDKNTNITEVRSHKPAAFAAIAAVLVLAVGGAVYASRYNTTRIDSAVPAAQSETDPDSADTEGQTKPGDYYTADGKKANDWAEKYLAQNEDTFGYISIPDMEFTDGRRAIDFPVAASEDNRFYLTHAFDKTEDPNGCIFADYSAVDGSQPQIIQLFGSASFSDFSWDYDSEYWRIRPEAGADTEKPGFTALLFYNMSKAISQAPVIEFKTIWQDGGEYMIFGCTTVQGDALGIGKVDDIGEWVSGIRDLSEFDVDIDCGADDEYLVLNMLDGDRTGLRVFAKKLDESDDKEKIISSYREKEDRGYDDPDEIVKTEDGRRLVNIILPLPDGIGDMYLLEIYSGDEELSDDTFADEDRKISGGGVTAYDAKDIPKGSVIFSIPGEGRQKFTVALIDPLSSDSTRNRVKYAVLDVDFDEGKYTVVGAVNTSGALEMFAKYPKHNMLIPLEIPDETKDIYFDTYMDGKCVDTQYVKYVDLYTTTAPTNIILNSTGKNTITVYARKSTEKTGFEYASFDVDFDTGKFGYRENGEEKQGALKAYMDGKVSPVFIEIPVPAGYEENVIFEAYYEDILMGSVLYTKDSDRPFGITLVEDGVDRISITAVFEDKTVTDYMVMDVDFDIMTYEFTPDGEPELGLFDRLE